MELVASVVSGIGLLPEGMANWTLLYEPTDAKNVLLSQKTSPGRGTPACNPHRYVSPPVQPLSRLGTIDLISHFFITVATFAPPLVSLQRVF